MRTQRRPASEFDSSRLRCGQACFDVLDGNRMFERSDTPKYVEKHLA